MNKVTRDIAKFCGCTLEHAWKIQEQMGNDGFDFSEATDAEFYAAVVAADAELLLSGTDPFSTVEGGRE